MFVKGSVNQQGQDSVFLPFSFTLSYIYIYRVCPLHLSFPEPSTSRASLNFHDALSRPPLNRSHLHFSSHDGSPALGGALFSQPSTSTSNPFAVSSSFSLVKEIKDSSSQHEDDNISTTSGFSSRASDKGKSASGVTLNSYKRLATFITQNVNKNVFPIMISSRLS